MFPFGAVARCLGYLTYDQIQEAIAIEKMEATTGRVPRLIGEILVEIGSLSIIQVETVLMRQKIVNHRFSKFNRSSARRREWLNAQAGSR